MNKFMLSLLLTAMLALPIAQAADEEDHSAHHPGAEEGQTAATPDNMAGEMKMEKMQEKMKTMREQMEKIQATADPQERQKLMEEHMQSMREGMKTMRGMGGKMGSKKDGPMTDDGAKEKDGKPMGMMMMKRHKMMEDRMEMMEMMMEQMMEHENAERMMERGR